MNLPLRGCDRCRVLNERRTYADVYELMRKGNSSSPTALRPLMSKTLVGAACLSLQPLALNAISVPVMAFIIRRLGPTGYGQWAIATSLLAVTAVLTNLGQRGTFVRAVAADPDSAAPALADQLGLRLLLGVLASVIAVAACGLLRYPPIVLECVVLSAVGLVLTTIASTLADLLQSFSRVKTLAAVNLAAGLALTGASVLGAVYAKSPAAIAAAYITGPLVSVIVLAIIVRRRYCRIRIRWNLSQFWKLIMNSRFFAAQHFLAVASAQAEALVLPRQVGAQQFGLFTAGTLLATRLTALPDGLCTAAYPVMSVSRDTRRGASLVMRCLFIAAAGGTLIALCIILAAHPLGRLLLPRDSASFATIVWITTWSLPLIGLESVMGYALNAAGADRAQARVSFPATLVSLAVSVSLVISLGVTGACWSMLLRPLIRAAFLTPIFVRIFCQPREIPALCVPA